MVLKIGTTDVSKVVMTYKKSQACRGQSVQYSLNGTAHVDRFSHSFERRQKREFSRMLSFQSQLITMESEIVR